MTDKVAEIKAMPLSRSQQAVELVRRLGMSYSEAARVVGITKQAVGLEARKQGLRGIAAAGRRAIGFGSVQCSTRPDRKAAIRRRAANYRASLGYPSPISLLEMHERNGATYKQIADRFALTRSQVAGFIHRARKDATTYA